MEATGGQPDIITLDGQPVFVDCSPESPNGRRSLCYDQAALKLRKVAPPRGDAVSLAAQMGVEILTIDQYHRLQALDKFDQKTSSWLATPNNIRELGGAIFGDRRYDTVFTYHNGADSYYAARGFRCLVRI
jgi:sensor domain CHASE-containing protein